MNNKGQINVGGVIGSILFVVVFIIIISSLASFMNTNDSRIDEINKLNSENAKLKGNILDLQTKIDQEEAIISSMNESIGTKEQTISDLTGEISKKNQEIQTLSTELAYYSEKKYVEEINNNYYTISNNISYIEHKFYIINLYLTLLSITLLTLIGELIGIRKRIFKFYQKITHKETNTEIKIEK